MEKLWQIVRDIVGSHSKTMLWLGIAVFILGTAGGVRHDDWFRIADGWPQWTLMVAGVVLVGLSFRKQTPDGLDQARIDKLGIKITAPQVNEQVTSRIRVTVVSDEPIPAGYELQVLRGYPKVKGIVPHAKTHQTPGKKEWVTHDFDVGGIPKDTRTIEVWLIGPDGDALLKTWEANHEVVAAANREARRLGELAKQKVNVEWLPPIVNFTADMHRCGAIVVTRI
jgi:hypothetical protein